jgi:SAM-dependent methyltransferase
MNLINSLKKLPIDLGQGNLRRKTKGKEIALSLIGRTRGTALDVGCREGHQTRLLESMGFIVTPIDVVKEFEQCIIMDANNNLEFRDNEFDLIWCSEVIEHLDDPAKSVSEFRRVLKNSGRLIITTPNSYCWIFRLFSLFGLTPDKLQHPGHKHFFSYKNIRELFPHGEIYGFFPYVLVKFRIRRLVGALSPTFVVMEQHQDNALD